MIPGELTLVPWLFLQQRPSFSSKSLPEEESLCVCSACLAFLGLEDSFPSLSSGAPDCCTARVGGEVPSRARVPPHSTPVSLIVRPCPPPPVWAQALSRAQQQLAWAGEWWGDCQGGLWHVRATGWPERQQEVSAGVAGKWRSLSSVCSWGNPASELSHSQEVMEPGPLPPSTYIVHHTPLQPSHSRNEEVPQNCAWPARVRADSAESWPGGCGHSSHRG